MKLLIVLSFFETGLKATVRRLLEIKYNFIASILCENFDNN